MKSYLAKPSEVERNWFVVDVEGLVLGRAASQIAAILFPLWVDCWFSDHRG